MIDDALDIGFDQQFRPCHRHLMDQQVGAFAVAQNVCIVAGIARDDGDPALILDAVAIGRLDGIAVVDRERDDTLRSPA